MVRRFSVCIRASPLHGKGLFATQYIPPNTLIVPYSGILLSDAQVCSQYPEGGDYLIASPESRFYINAQYPDGCLGVGGMANHSSAPNAALEYTDLTSQLTQPCFEPIWIRAIHPIEAGMEIVVDYGCRYWRSD